MKNFPVGQGSRSNVSSDLGLECTFRWEVQALARDLKLTPGSKPTVIDYPFEGNIRGTLWLSLLFASLGGLEHATAEDLLIALKAICPDVKDWDSAIGGLYRH